MKFNRLFFVAALACVALAGCRCPCGAPGPKVDAEGFTWFDGTFPAVAPSEYYIVRFERPGGIVETGWQKGLSRWLFTEVRQLRDGVTIIEDGAYRDGGAPTAGVNWAKRIRAGARNVRYKFVGPDYTVEKDGRLPVPRGYVELFNGRDLTGWKGVTREENFHLPDVRRAAWPEKREAMQAKADEMMRRHWFVKDGQLYFDGKDGGYSLATAKDYGNFDLLCDWRLLRVHGDSGFYPRGICQVQIWDPDTWGGLGSGGLYNDKIHVSNATSRQDNPIGDWNRCRIRMIGDKVTVWLNGKVVVNGVPLEDYRNPAGIPLIQQLELQCHGDPILFRNIFIKELPESPADVPDPAKAVRGDKIDLLANGLADWEAADAKARMGWGVKDGILSNFVTDDPASKSRGGSGGTHLKTKRADFFDFDLSYDVLVPAKCNSGVYLRGRYEIQVLDSYGKPADRHSMAALYEHIAPSVSAEKPAGEWQHVDVTLYRRHITVTLNGVKVIDNKPIPGVTPAAMDGNEFAPGPILLQGDHSNASFRNMVLTPILK